MMKTVTMNMNYLELLEKRITFMIVDRNSIKVAVEINEICVNKNKCNNIVPATRTRKLRIWELVLKSSMISTQKSTVKD